MPTKPTLSGLQKILDDIEKIYTSAFQQGKYSVALKAKELLGKEFGLFQVTKNTLNLKEQPTSTFVARLSLSEIKSLVKIIEEYISLVRKTKKNCNDKSNNKKV